MTGNYQVNVVSNNLKYLYGTFILESFKKHWIIKYNIKYNFEIPLLLIKNVYEKTAAFDYYKHGYFPSDQQMKPSKKVISVVTFAAS